MVLTCVVGLWWSHLWQADVCAGFCICLDTSAGPGPSYLAYQMCACRACVRACVQELPLELGPASHLAPSSGSAHVLRNPRLPVTGDWAVEVVAAK